MDSSTNKKGEAERPPDDRERLARLETLERRIARIEETLGLPPLPSGSNVPSVAERTALQPTGGRHHLAFTSVAAASFALGLALVLRTAAKLHWVPPAWGVGLGLAYCGVLVALPLLRAGSVSSLHKTLQVCGGLLAPLIVVEARHKLGVVGPELGAGILGVGSLLAAIVASRRQTAVLALTALPANVVALAAIGPWPSAVLARGGVWLGVLVLGIWLARKERWSYLLPATLLPTMVVVGICVLTTARRPGISQLAAVVPVLTTVGIWLVTAVNYATHARALTRFERASLPLATIWCYGLALFCAATVAVPVGAATALVMLLLSGWSGFGAPSARRGLLLSSALLGAVSGPLLEPTGLSLGLFALLQLIAGRRIELTAVSWLSLTLGLLALLSAGLHGPLLDVGAWPQGPLGAVGLALLLFELARRLARADAGDTSVAPTVALAAGSAALLCGIRQVAAALLGQGPYLQLALTATLALTSFALLGMARWLGRRTVTRVWLLGVAALGGKVVFWDLLRLEGAPVIVSVLTLGLAAAAASVVLKRRRAAERVTTDAAEGTRG